MTTPFAPAYDCGILPGGRLTNASMNPEELPSALANEAPRLVRLLQPYWRNVLIVGAALFVGFLVCDLYLGLRLSETDAEGSGLSVGLPTLRATKPYLMWGTLVFILIMLAAYAIFARPWKSVARRRLR